MGSYSEKKEVLLVDNEDKPIGTMDKLEAHRKGVLHRSVSVFIFNQKGEWLLQRRTAFKYHSGGLWSNTCSAHPYPGEYPEEAAQRRLAEELGISCTLQKAFTFTYQAQLDHGFIENEYDHVFIGYTDSFPDADPSEVWDWKYLPSSLIRMDEQANPEKYTIWFRKIYPQILQQRQ